MSQGEQQTCKHATGIDEVVDVVRFETGIGIHPGQYRIQFPSVSMNFRVLHTCGSQVKV